MIILHRLLHRRASTPAGTVLFPSTSISFHWRRLSLSLARGIRGGKHAAIL